MFVVIHGGYWRALSRHDTAFMARTLEGKGIATVTVDYGLAPTTRLEEIVRQVRTAVAWVHRHGPDYGLDSNRIVVGGSSAGGHLTASTMMSDWQPELGLPLDVVKAALPVSGLFDVRPLVDSFANEWLSLDPSTAAHLSPLLRAGDSGPRAVIAVAEHDGTGFLDQSREFHSIWEKHSPSELLIVPDRNHYDVFLDLSDPKSSLTSALVRLVHSIGGA
ncbi:alpha/beta hydrolase [Rhodococcus sp. ACT016]|uniref:alpha/beta hydrolase n=1 Tax=Rhodococcus sp. ACT016 TaxID=3134808 RepID=UPI003D273A92